MTTALTFLAAFAIIWALLYIAWGVAYMAVRAVRWCWSRLAPR